MSEWPMVKLKELMRKTKSIDPRKYPDEEFALYSIPAYDNGIPEKIFGRDIGSSKILLKDSDVVLSKIVPHIRRTWVITDGEKQIGSSEWMVFNDDRFDPQFIANYLKSDVFHYQLLTTVAGVGGSLNRARPAAVAELKIPLPPLGEQKRIAEILGRTSQAIKATENIIHKAQGLKRSVLRDILNNKSGEYVQLSQISSVQSGITKGRKVQNKITLMPTPYMAVSNVKAGYLDLSEVKQIDASEAEVNRYQLQAGDILLTEGGDPDKLGRGTIWRNEIPGAIHQNHIFRVRINPDSGFTSEALMAILESTESKGYFLRSAKQTTGISSINKRQLSATPIPVLGKVQIEELTNMWHKIDEVIELYHRKLSLLQELQKSLATRAFAGLL